MTSTTDLVYRPSPAGIDLKYYDIATARGFRDDAVASATVADLETLASSLDWQDRVRAEVLRRCISITLPDQFPCLYETADSPNHSRHKDKRPHPWVVSPDMDMLTTLLPDYQRLWDAHTHQWGPSARRVFAVGRLDGLSPYGLFRPGAIPADVIGRTLLLHTDMCRSAPQDLRQMHPTFGSKSRPTTHQEA